MATYCGRTGEVKCKCLADRQLTPKTALQVDLKSTMRKLFTDHGVYTAFVLKSIVDGIDDVKVFLSRLLQNQKDIGDQVKPIVGDEKGAKLTTVLTEHIKLAGAVMTAATKKDPDLDDQLKKLYANSDVVAATLTSLNPEKLPYTATQPMFETHNRYVVGMTTSRIAKNYEQEQKWYDAYYNEILEMADAITAALV